MIDLFVLLLIGLVIGIVYVIKILVILFIAPFYFGGMAAWSLSQSGIADSISKLDSDDFVAYVCDILRMKGYADVRRYPGDMDIVLARLGNRKIMCACFGNNICKVTSKSINYAIRRAHQLGVTQYAICYSGEITNAALRYASEKNVIMADSYVIAGSYIEARKQVRRNEHRRNALSSLNK